jgi:DNA-directed RNA polymerase specialized sigma24 family protein
VEQVDTALVELTDVIRRTVGVRTRDVDLIEDVTQETLVKVA